MNSITLIIIIIIILLLIFIYCTFNLYNKLNKLESEYNNQLNQYDELIKSIYSMFFTTYNRMMKLDKNKTLYTDPDVNFIYQNIIQLMDKIRLHFLENINTQQNNSLNE